MSAGSQYASRATPHPLFQQDQSSDGQPASDSSPSGSRSRDELCRRVRTGDADAMSEFFRHHKDRLRRIVAIGLAVRLARVLDGETWSEEAARSLLLGQREADVATEAGLLQWMARVIEREVRRTGDRPSGTTVERRRGLRLGEEGEGDALRTQREDLERVVDQRVAELEPAELREVVLLRDYCGADWELVRERMKLLSIEAAQELYRRAHRRLALRLPRLRRQR